MTDTRHLDAALRILKAPKRKATTASIHVHSLGLDGASVQVQGREVYRAATLGAALAEADRRAQAMHRLTGRKPTVRVFAREAGA